MNEVDYRFFLDKKYEKETKAKCGCKYFSNVNLHVEVLENALILPGDNQGRGGILFQGEMLPQSSYRRGVARLYEFVENDVFNSDEEVVWIGMWPTVWGHCLTDNLKHLWFLSQNPRDLKECFFLTNLLFIQTRGSFIQRNLLYCMIIQLFPPLKREYHCMIKCILLGQVGEEERILGKKESKPHFGRWVIMFCVLKFWN